MSKGVIYYATGEKHISEAVRSAESLKQHLPEISITLFSPERPTSSCFDNHISIQNHSEPLLDYISYLKKTPYDKTLFLDTDTYICGDISSVFDLLDEFDIAAAHDPVRHSSRYDPNVPETFPSFCTGVIPYRQTQDVFDFFTEWENLYRDYAENISERLYSPSGSTYANDCPLFREALYYSDLRSNILPDEYNCKFLYPGYAQLKIKILHIHHSNPQEIAKVANEHAGMRRVHTGEWLGRVYSVRENYSRPVEVAKYPGPGRFKKLLNRGYSLIQNKGIKLTIKKAIQWSNRQMKSKLN